MSDRGPSQPFLDLSVAADLEQEGLLSPVVNNKRKISILVTSSSSASSTSSVNTFSTVLTSASVSQNVDTITVPDCMSQEAYEYMGFTTTTAKELWRQYVELASEFQCSFEEFASMRINEFGCDVSGGLDDWNVCLDDIGINQELKDAIMLPEFADIRCTFSAKHWVREVVEERFEFLHHLEHEARLTLAQRHKAKKTGRRHAVSISETPSAPSPRSKKRQSASSFSGASQAPPTSSFAGPASTQPREHSTRSAPAQHQSDDTKGGKNVEDDGPEHQLVTADVDIIKDMPGHTTIWRAGYKYATLSMQDSQSGKLSLSHVGACPGDFSGLTRVTYFTPQKEVADLYAKWAKIRSKDQGVFITKVLVPDELLEKLKEETHFLFFEDPGRPKDEWKRVVWHGRNGNILPKDLAWVEKKDLLIGHILSGRRQKFRSQKESDCEALTIRDILHVEIGGHSRAGIQWVFMTTTAMRLFEEFCEGKVSFFSVGNYHRLKSAEVEL